MISPFLPLDYSTAIELVIGIVLGKGPFSLPGLSGTLKVKLRVVLATADSPPTSIEVKTLTPLSKSLDRRKGYLFDEAVMP